MRNKTTKLIVPFIKWVFRLFRIIFIQKNNFDYSKLDDINFSFQMIYFNVIIDYMIKNKITEENRDEKMTGEITAITDSLYKEVYNG